MAKKTDQTEGRIEAVEEALSKTERFIEDNQRMITIVVGVLIVVVLGYFGFQRYYLAPRDTEAQAQMFMAEKYFEQDSLDLALNGDGNYYGFLDIIRKYKMTKSASLSNYYAGLCYMGLGEYEDAIDHLRKFKGGDLLVGPMAKAVIGDAYAELGNLDKAAAHYMDAADINPNDLTTPTFLMKAAWAYELLGDNKKALDTYKKIQEEHPRSQESRDIEKYIARVSGAE